ncbi:MAG TPA: helix-turn-helix transcriptional regulator [Chloroflexota bacterium]|jgi:transcriptional regulator with XRE-family HTH domain|nr:helix-turn-helix transcriptional regulator [Chloroflexota bacterium]
MDERFATLLRHYRERAGLSCNELARAVDVDPSYISRLERGEREPPRRRVVDRLASALQLSREEHDRLLVSAGYAPATVAVLGRWDATLQAVADVLTDRRLAEREIESFRQIVLLLAERWRQPTLATS